MGQRSEQRVVLAMFQIQFQRKAGRNVVGGVRRHELREQSWDSPGIFIELGKTLAQEVFLVAYHGRLDGEEHYDQADTYLQASRCTANPIRSAMIPDKEDCACRRTARRWPGPHSYERGPRPSARMSRPAGARCASARERQVGPRQPEVKQGEKEIQRYADTARNVRPFSHEYDPSLRGLGQHFTGCGEYSGGADVEQSLGQAAPGASARLSWRDCAIRCSAFHKARFRAGSVGPKMVTTGTPRAAARCIGPVSPPTNKRARRARAINSVIEDCIAIAALCSRLRLPS